MINVTKKQQETLLRVRDRARKMQTEGRGQEKMSVTDAEYQLAKRKFQQLVDSGAVVPEKVMAIAKRMGFIS